MQNELYTKSKLDQLDRFWKPWHMADRAIQRRPDTRRTYHLKCNLSASLYLIKPVRGSGLLVAIFSLLSPPPSHPFTWVKRVGWYQRW